MEDQCGELDACRGEEPGQEESGREVPSVWTCSSDDVNVQEQDSWVTCFMGVCEGRWRCVRGPSLPRRKMEVEVVRRHPQHRCL